MLIAQDTLYYSKDHDQNLSFIKLTLQTVLKLSPPKNIYISQGATDELQDCLRRI